MTGRRTKAYLFNTLHEAAIGKVESDILHTEKILSDRKIFFLDLKENQRGKVVKITEDVGGNRDTIMVPAEILEDFISALSDIRDTAENS